MTDTPATDTLESMRDVVAHHRAEENRLRDAWGKAMDELGAARARIEQLEYANQELRALGWRPRRELQARIEQLEGVAEKAHYNLSCAANMCNDADVCAEIDRTRKLLRAALASGSPGAGETGPAPYEAMDHVGIPGPIGERRYASCEAESEGQPTPEREGHPPDGYDVWSNGEGSWFAVPAPTEGLGCESRAEAVGRCYAHRDRILAPERQRREAAERDNREWKANSESSSAACRRWQQWADKLLGPRDLNGDEPTRDAISERLAAAERERDERSEAAREQEARADMMDMARKTEAENAARAGVALTDMVHQRDDALAKLAAAERRAEVADAAIAEALRCLGEVRQFGVLDAKSFDELDRAVVRDAIGAAVHALMAARRTP